METPKFLFIKLTSMTRTLLVRGRLHTEMILWCQTYTQSDWLSR